MPRRVVRLINRNPGITALIVFVLAVVPGFIALNYAIDRANKGVENSQEVIDCLSKQQTLSSERALALAPIAAQRTNADNHRSSWRTTEDRIFKRALTHPPRTRKASARVKREYANALARELYWDHQYNVINDLYNKASDEHPVPDPGAVCKATFRKARPGPTATVTVTPSPSITHVPGPVQTSVESIPVPGPTTSITINNTKTKVVSQPPGKVAGLTVTVTVTASPSCSVRIGGICLSS